MVWCVWQADGNGAVDNAEFEKWWSAKGVNMMRKGKTTRIQGAEGTIAAVMSEIAVQGDDAIRTKSTEQIMCVRGPINAISKHLFSSQVLRCIIQACKTV